MAKYAQLPDLGVEGKPIMLNLWLVKQGACVGEGEPLVEVMVGPVTVDLPSPGNGLVKKLVGEGESICVGQRLAIIEPNEEQA